MRISPELKKLFKRGYEDPAFFIENVVGMSTLWEKQKEIAYSVRDNKFTAVRSCNGAGKTFTTANIVTWFLVTRPNSIVISTAPTARQVEALLWQEINNVGKGSRYPLGGRLLNTSWTLGPKWFALGLSTDDPNRFQGFHAENILGVIDEAAGVEDPIWVAMDAILTSSGARLLVIGNPTEPSGNFFNAFSSPLWNKIHISAFDTPNFTENGITLLDIKTGKWKEKNKKLVYPALITPQWVSERYQEWGEDSPAFQSRILGNFPSIGTDTMIPLGWVLRAVEREITFKADDRVIVAVDVARFGDDESVIGLRKGKSYTRQEVLNNADVPTLARAAARVADEEKYDYIIVDAVGIGAGVADLLRSWGYNVIEFIAQGRAWEPEKFTNRRVEAWYRVREKFRKDEINIIDDDVLVGQLTSPKYDFDSAGRYRLEPKEKMKDRGLKSPDRADALIMAFDFDGVTGTSVLELERINQPKPNTVEALLRQLTQGEVSDIKWHMT